MNKLIIRVFLFSLIIPPLPGLADDGAVKLKNLLQKQAPGAAISNVKESPIKGLYEVTVGANVVYMDGDARYMLDGDLVDRLKRENITELARSSIRSTLLSSLGDDKMIVYKPKEVKHSVTVVTDIDCPYCRRLHEEMDEYMGSGIKVRYLFMPLKGKKDFDKTVSVWCAKDQNKALDTVKAGGSIEAKTCDNPIKDHLAIARQLGVRGTPAIILESGELIGGYVPVKKLVKDYLKE